MWGCGASMLSGGGAGGPPTAPNPHSSPGPDGAFANPPPAANFLDAARTLSLTPGLTLTGSLPDAAALDLPPGLSLLPSPSLLGSGLLWGGPPGVGPAAQPAPLPPPALPPGLSVGPAPRGVFMCNSLAASAAGGPVPGGSVVPADDADDDADSPDSGALDDAADADWRARGTSTGKGKGKTASPSGGPPKRRSGRSGTRKPGARARAPPREPGSRLAPDPDVDDPRLTEAERKKLKRRLANRESARRVRKRRVEQEETLQGQIEGLQAENRRLLDACSRSDADDVAARADLAHARERWVAATQDNEGLRRELDALRRALEGNVRAMQAVTCGGDGQALTPLVAGSGYAHHASPASASGPETPLGDPLRARGSSPPSAGAPPEAATLYSPFEAYARL